MRKLRSRHAEGQTLVEFALVAPIFFAVVFGVIASGWLFFQSEAVSSAAQSGAREALVENFTATTGQTCEDPSSGVISVEAAAQHAASLIPVDTNALCGAIGETTACPNDNTLSCQELTQTAQNGTAQLTIYAEPNFTVPSYFVVDVSYQAHPFAPFVQQPISLTSQSILSAQGVATTDS